MSVRSNRINTLALCTAVALAAVASPALAGQADLSGLKAGNVYDRFIIKFRKGSAPSINAAAMTSSLRAASAHAKMPASHRGGQPTLRAVRQMALPGMRVIASQTPLSHDAAAALMRQIAADSNVEFIQIDGNVRTKMLPNDPKFSAQWHYADSAAGIRAPTAWNITNGAGVVVAVIDSGILSHTDLNANVLPGYDFVSSVSGSSEQECAIDGLSAGCGKSLDGDGRDANPVDSENNTHGTHVAGTIAAVTNNGAGVAGIAFGAKIVPIRAAGSEGFNPHSDTIDALVWASGGSVPGVPANPNPAEVINLSLGSDNAGCSPAWQAGVDAAVANGSIVIAAAGNGNNDVAGNVPAGCNKVVSVAASTKSGARTSYSAWGATIDVTAPGGDGSFNSSNDVLSTIDNNGYGAMAGTSMASPHAAGVAALIVAASPTPKTPAQIEQILKSTARPIPVNNCSGGCGAGLVDAAAAVTAAAGGGTPVNKAPVANFSSTVNGLSVSFSDGSTDSDGSIASRSWSFGDGTTSTATNPSKSYASAGSYTVTLTVTDNGGATHSKTATVTVSGGSSGVQTYTNGADVNIPDNNAAGVSSSITVSGRNGNAPSNAQVSVNIVHPYKGDLIVDLIAPDGSVYNIHNQTGSSTDNVSGTFTFNLSSEPLNGIWKLRAADRGASDVGRIDTWSIKF